MKEKQELISAEQAITYLTSEEGQKKLKACFERGAKLAHEIQEAAKLPDGWEKWRFNI
jgi:hypothetical protein